MKSGRQGEGGKEAEKEGRSKGVYIYNLQSIMFAKKDRIYNQ